MEAKRNSTNTLAVLLLISILLHLLLVIPFINLNFDVLPESPLLEKLKKLRQEINPPIPEQEEWATIAPHQGAPVIVIDADDEPNDPHVAANQTEQNQEYTTEPDQPEPERIIEEQKNIAQKELLNIPHIKQGDIPAAIQTTENKIEEEKKEESTFANMHPAAQAITDKSPDKQKKSLPKTPQPLAQKKQPPTIAKKPSLTLAKIAQGFAKHMEQEADISIAMVGKSNAKATEAQLRMGRLFDKVASCIMTSWRTAPSSKFPFDHSIKVDIHFNIAINKDGSLNKITLTRSSGNTFVDAYVLNIIRDASSSFPPLPDYLNYTVLTIRCDWDNLLLPHGPMQLVASQ